MCVLRERSDAFRSRVALTCADVRRRGRECGAGVGRRRRHVRRRARRITYCLRMEIGMVERTRDGSRNADADECAVARGVVQWCVRVH